MTSGRLPFIAQPVGEPSSAAGAHGCREGRARTGPVRARSVARVRSFGRRPDGQSGLTRSAAAEAESGACADDPGLEPGRRTDPPPPRPRPNAYHPNRTPTRGPLAAMRRLTGTVAVLALVAGLTSACKIPDPGASSSPGTGNPSAAGGALPGGSVPSGTDNLITEPDQGLSSIYSLMSSAKKTLDMTMYELTDSQAEQILEQDAKNGVTVRVILDQYLEKKSNQPAYTALTAAGVHVVWASSSYITHQKTITVDGSVSCIMTLNLTSQYYSTSRDFAVVDHDAADVGAIEQVFNADFTGAAITPPAGDDLVWSPKQSDTALIALINSATKSLVVENEEMADTGVVSALTAAAQRGVAVEVIMTNDSSWKSNFGKLTKAGVKVSTYKASASLYIHAKVILVDDNGSSAIGTTKVFLGSENFSQTSLDRNRELGLITTDPAILASVSSTVNKDFAGATAFSS